MRPEFPYSIIFCRIGDILFYSYHPYYLSDYYCSFIAYNTLSWLEYAGKTTSQHCQNYLSDLALCIPYRYNDLYDAILKLYFSPVPQNPFL